LINRNYNNSEDLKVNLYLTTNILEIELIELIKL
jgi:hypothetical protein